MSAAAGFAIAAGAITLTNEVVFAPVLGEKVAINWRLIPATAGLALGLAGLEKLAPQFAVGLAVLTLIGALTISIGNAPTPLQNATKALGYTK